MGTAVTRAFWLKADAWSADIGHMEPMSSDVSFSCVKHPMTLGEQICGECGHQFCNECVVFPFGTSRPPLCITCALEKGGVRRQSVGRPKLSRRSIRERLALQRTAIDQQDASSVGSLPAPEDEAWLGGQVDPAGVPGAWKREY